jgi:hypothetical protein
MFMKITQDHKLTAITVRMWAAKCVKNEENNLRTEEGWRETEK